MAITRSARLKKILAKDPAFTNVLAATLMLCFESLWAVILFDSGRMTVGINTGWSLQLVAAGLIIILTAPFLLGSVFLASSMSDVARRIIRVCSILIGLASAVFAAGVWLEVGAHLPMSFMVTRLPFVLFGIFTLMRIRLLRTQTIEV
jgi:hypothetical protein